MNHTLIRRKAHCALVQAIRTAGIPEDYCVIPHMDHPVFLPTAEDRVIWCRTDPHNSRSFDARAIIVFNEDGLTGYVEGSYAHDLAESSNFNPEDYNIPYYDFVLPFDITDIADFDSWEALPIIPTRRRPRSPVIKVIGGINQ